MLLPESNPRGVMHFDANEFNYFRLDKMRRT